MNQGEETNAAEQQREIAGTEITRELLLALLPTSMGLMLARTGMIVGAYGSYMGTDAGIYTDGASFISLVPLLLFMVALGLTDKIIPKRAIFHSTNLCIALEAIGIAAVALIEAHAPGFTVARMAASTLVTASAWICMFYWLRRCRGASCTTVVIIVLGAMIVSETILYVFSFIPRMVHCLIFAMAVLAQYAAIAAARHKPLPAEIDIKSTSHGYFHFAQKNADSVRFLGIIAIGSFLMSIAIGFLKGFPNGDPIPFTHVTRLLYVLLIDGVFIGLLWGTIKGKKNTMTIGTWVVMQGLGSIALLLFALFPERLDIGAVFGNAMNVTMTGFILYLIIAFSSYGHRDAYYYAIAGWGVFIFPRSLVRVTSIALYAQFPSTSLPTALCGGLLLISAQFIFLQFLMLERDETAATKAAAISVQRLLGIKDEAAPGTEMRKAIVRESAQEMQKQFLLSDRETEVLTLYAMGLTQAKIAEELCIAPGTAHTHVKRIYSKTDLHSRQALLDYIERYTD